MKELLRATSITSVVTALTIIVSIVRGKALALLIGPEGIGVTSQILSFLDLSTSFLSLGMGVGITKFVAEYKATSRFEELRVFVVTAFLTSLAISSVAALAIILLSGQISQFAFGSLTYSGLVLIAAIALPARIAGALSSTVLQGLKEIVKLAQSSAINAIAGIAIILFLVLKFGLTGVIVAVVFSSFLGLGLGILFIRKSLIEHKISDRSNLIKGITTLPSLYRLNSLTPLVGYGVSSLVVGFFGQGVDFLVRSDLIKTLGVDANGIYQSAFVISSNYVFIVLNSMTVYALPHFSEISSDIDAIRREITTTFRFALITITPMIAVIMATNSIIIPLLFSHRFAAATSILPLQLVSDFFQASAWSLGMCLLPTRQVKFWFGVSLGFQILSLIAFKLLLPVLGIQAAVYDYLFGWIVAVLAIYIFLTQKFGYRLGWENVKLILTSLAIILTVFALEKVNVILAIASLLLLVPWLLLVVHAEERIEVKNMVMHRLSRVPFVGGLLSDG